MSDIKEKVTNSINLGLCRRSPAGFNGHTS